MQSVDASCPECAMSGTLADGGAFPRAAHWTRASPVGPARRTRCSAVFAANALGDGGPGSLTKGQILYVDALRNDPTGRVLVAGLSAGHTGIALARIFP
jgi:hypothetical protein